MNAFTIRIGLCLACSACLFQAAARADVSYQETTKINGGSMMGMLKMAIAFSAQARQVGEPTTSTVMIHGNQMVRTDPHNTEVIDLDQHTITTIDNAKRTYSTVTFEQMKEAMTKAAAKAKESPKLSGGDPANQLKFNAHITRSGATRELDGKTAKEALLTVTMLANANDGSNAQAGMAATSEMWMIDSAPGLEEMRAFSKRMASELGFEIGSSPAGGMLAAYPGASQALADLKKESAGMSGLPVLQITRVGMSADGQPLPAPSVLPLPAPSKPDSNKPGEVTKEIATNTGTQTASDQIARLGSFGRALGGSSMGALMKHKPAPAAPPSSSADVSAATAGILMESQTEMSNFSTAPVNPSSFQVPSGYKQVQSPMTH